MRTRLIIWEQSGKLFAHITREKTFGTIDTPCAGGEIWYIAVTRTDEDDERTLRRMAVMELTRPTPTKIFWYGTDKVWKF